MVLVRLDPERFGLVPYSYRELRDKKPLNIEQWANVLPEAAVLFNSGLYYPDYGYMGWFVKNGARYGSGRHLTWQGLLLSGRRGGESSQFPEALIVDLKTGTYNPENSRYRYALQSFMLIDDQGKPRVRQSDRLASRTVLVQDSWGRFVVVFVPGACTLYELALLLKHSDLDIARAMSLDGGFESQLFIREGKTRRSWYGRWVVNEHRQYHNPNLKLPLPAVVSIIPLDGQSSHPDR
jgi:uncharacterized protein YigE (DUF2233 family)